MVVVVGLTGGIACGKSTVSSMMRDDEGLRIIDADRIAIAAMAPGTALARRVAERFKDVPGLLEADGSINRERLGDAIFASAEKRRLLGQMTRWPIVRQMLWEIAAAWWSCRADDILVLDVPLLFETKVFAWLCELIVVVSVPPAVQKKRLMTRNGYTDEQATIRMASQMPTHEKVKRATHVVDNGTSLVATRKAVALIVAGVRGRPQRWLSPIRLLVLATLSLAVAPLLGLYAWTS